MKLSSPAKINLSLRVLGRREDGFHAVDTRMCPISLADDVTVTLKGSGDTVLTCSDPTIPTNDGNLALKALHAFERHLGTTASWEIHLEKRIPHGAGLGGGSSNAASVLLAANELSGSPFSANELSSIAAEIGSDVPFFLHQKACDATGRGEIVTPVEHFPWKLPLVLLKPPFGIPTPWAYKRWVESVEMPGVTYATQICPWGPMVNDLERPVFEKWSLLPTLKMWLLDQPETQAALMSGSGSTVFAVTRSTADAGLLAERARALCGESTHIFVAETL
ncbi:4-(cytidine 5'-diphospho)-2-C-methyl-D-erythritol kinase [Roseimicrobium sp. ORNL1]|uniref:4-(cytidine 5'-diphospho)-2-C-methyl-D-erythritol kinase n=1 Tax=Roseimicrobium sp. ORNL1 TaxID=2711231 RepID=UPI001F0FA526|nr:4-(cytidine 5'-diphospho)-2-C-methyl-D-erythritol kinase [Roseimicrobium sp. ORNL1]